MSEINCEAFNGYKVCKKGFLTPYTLAILSFLMNKLVLLIFLTLFLLLNF